MAGKNSVELILGLLNLSALKYKQGAMPWNELEMQHNIRLAWGNGYLAL